MIATNTSTTPSSRRSRAARDGRIVWRGLSDITLLVRLVLLLIGSVSGVLVRISGPPADELSVQQPGGPLCEPQRLRIFRVHAMPGGPRHLLWRPCGGAVA